MRLRLDYTVQTGSYRTCAIITVPKKSGLGYVLAEWCLTSGLMSDHRPVAVRYPGIASNSPN